MKNILILLLLGISFCGLKLEYSNFNDGTVFMNRSGVSYFEIINKDKLELGFVETNTGSKRKSDLSLTYDKDYQGELSPFGLVTYTENQYNGLNKTRAGLGLAYTPFKNVNVFPYRHKLSYALIGENGNLINSVRYKTNGYVNKFGWDITAFILSYTWNVDTRLSYKVDKNVSLLYILYIEDYKGTFNSSSFGVEVNF
jgi:outer membrane receptor for monomeric catechols